MNDIEGLAHVCFLPPFGKDDAHSRFFGHVVGPDMSGRSFGIAGQLIENPPENVIRNDCMDPEIFYKMIVKDYSKDETIELLVRRRAFDDAGGLHTDPDDDEHHNHGQTCVFETEKFLAGQQALSFCKKYLGDVDVDEEDVIVCLGLVTFKFKLESDD